MARVWGDIGKATELRKGKVGVVGELCRHSEAVLGTHAGATRVRPQTSVTSGETGCPLSA